MLLIHEGRSIESELQKRREQAESVRGKDTPFRVEFRYEGGTKHWQYFVSEQDAISAEDSMCLYGPTGNPVIRLPLSHVIQVRGSRGGWSKIKTCSLCGVRSQSANCPVLIDEASENVCTQCYLDLKL